MIKQYVCHILHGNLEIRVLLVVFLKNYVNYSLYHFQEITRESWQYNIPKIWLQFKFVNIICIIMIHVIKIIN